MQGRILPRPFYPISTTGSRSWPVLLGLLILAGCSGDNPLPPPLSGILAVRNFVEWHGMNVDETIEKAISELKKEQGERIKKDYKDRCGLDLSDEHFGESLKRGLLLKPFEEPFPEAYY